MEKPIGQGFEKHIVFQKPAENSGGGTESDRRYRPFREIQDELASLINNPNPTRERELRMERGRLINEARAVGVDMGILHTIKPAILDIQNNSPSLLTAATEIQRINTQRLEEEAMGIVGWRDEFTGLIDAYRDGALRNMSLEALRKLGAPQDQIDELQREIDLLNWGVPPTFYRGLPLQPPTTLTPQGVGAAGQGQIVVNLDAAEFGRKVAEAQGILSPRAYLYEAVDGEEFLKTAQRIVPGQEPRFWIALNDKEKNEWQARSTLWIIAAKKQAAFSSSELTMDKMHDMAVDLNKWALQILLGNVERGEVLGEGKDGVLPAASIYTTIIGDPRFLNYRQATDLSLKQVFFDGMPGIADQLVLDYGPEGAQKLAIQASELRNRCPDSMYPHETNPDKGGWGTTINAEGFKALRASLRHWLTTSGRDLLLTQEEMANREAFFADKDRALADLEFRAREAEIIAWNFVYSTGLLETFDSRAYRPAGTKRHGPSGFWSLALWTSMHLQERFEQKVIRGSNSDKMEAKEEWAGLVGTWALNQYKKGVWTTVNPDGSKSINIPRILPDVIFRGALFNKFIFETGRDARTQLPERGLDNKTLFALLNGIGNDVLFNTANVNRFDLAGRINWDDISDTPFVSYVWDETRWGNVVEKAFKKGEASQVDLRDLGEAVRNLRFPRKVRENLLMIYDSINVQKPQLTPKEGELKWRTFNLRAYKEYFPAYFLEN